MSPRWFVLLALAACAPVPARSPRFAYPETRREGVRDVLHGVVVADPYRWLEGDDAEVDAWSHAQDDRARARIATLSAEIDPLWARMRALWKGLPPKADTADVARFRRGLATLERITQFAISPDGKRVAIEISRSGADMRTLRVADLATGATLEELGGIEGSRVVWARDGFFYTYTPPGAPHATRFAERSIRFHRPGDAQERDRVVVPPSHDRDASANMNPLALTDDGALLLVEMPGDWRRRAFAVVDTATSRVRPIDGAWFACTAGASVLVAVRHADETFSIVRWRGDAEPQIVARVDARLVGMKRVGPYVVLREARGASTRYEIYDESFTLVRARETPPGTTEEIEDATRDALTLVRQGLRTPPERVEIDLATGREQIVARAPVDFDADAMTIDETVAVSKDGTRVPLTILRRKDFVRDRRAPAWVYGYGGFGVSAEQIFYPPWVAWAERGGVFAICHARGGLEQGEPWHEGGARRHRQDALDDFAACLRELHARGYSAPERTMTQGWSHGGMFVSAVAMQHPELQRVVFAMVPLADMIRFPLFGRGGVSEYGDPANADDFRALLAFSPYHRVRDGVAYPAFFITASSNDERVAPLHARKLAAALEHASTGGEVLLEIHWGAGHHGGGREDANRSFAEAAIFALHAFARGAR